MQHIKVQLWGHEYHRNGLNTNGCEEQAVPVSHETPVVLLIERWGKSLVCVRGKKQYNPQRDLIIVIHLWITYVHVQKLPSSLKLILLLTIPEHLVCYMFMYISYVYP